MTVSRGQHAISFPALSRTYIFSGYRTYTSSGSRVKYSNSLYRVSEATNTMRLVSGSIDYYEMATYDEFYSASNHPSARASMVYFRNRTHLFVLGGLGYSDQNNTVGYLGDLHVFDVSTEQWMFSGLGCDCIDAGGFGGSVPIERQRASSVVDDAMTNLYLFGGRHYTGFLHSMWKLHIPSLSWTLLHGIEEPETMNWASIYQAGTGFTTYARPGGRTRAVMFIHGGSAFLFGGEGFEALNGTYDRSGLDSMWEYGLSSGRYRFLAGSKSNNSLPDYGDGSSFGPSVHPPAMNPEEVEPSTWLCNSNSEFYVFSGVHPHKVYWFFNDLFLFNVSLGQWRLVTGDRSSNSLGSSTIPSARKAGMTWIDSDSSSYCRLYLFGGYGKGSGGSSLVLGDFWMFSTRNGTWHLVSGTRFGEDVAMPSFAASVTAQFNVGNSPGARMDGIAWSYGAGGGYFYLLGGFGITTSAASQGYVSDMWVFEIDPFREVTCYGVSNFSSSVCGEHGTCVGIDVCECDISYFGMKCVEEIGPEAMMAIDMKTIRLPYACAFEVVQATVTFIDAFNCGDVVANADAILGTAATARKCRWVVDGVNVAAIEMTIGTGVVASTLIGQFLSVHPVTSLLPLPDDVYPFEIVETPTGGPSPPPTDDDDSLYVILGASIGGVAGVCGIVIFVVVLVVAIVCCGQQRKLKKLKTYEKDIEFLEMERAHGSDAISTVKIRKDLFKIKREDLKLTKPIGAGGFCTVYEAQWKDLTCAVKVFKTTSIGSDSEHFFEDFQKEVTVLTSLAGHPNILGFYGLTVEPPTIGIVMELCENGTLKDYVSINRPELAMRQKWLYQVASGLSYLHDRNVIHRDMKCENVLLTSDLTAKVIDFGLAKIVDAGSGSRHTKRTGTSYYMAPEYGKDLQYAVEMKVANDDKFRPKIDPGLEESTGWLVQLMKDCWTAEAAKRPTFRDICSISQFRAFSKK